MSNALIALLVSLGGCAWVYGKMMRKTGNNNQSALTVTAMLGVFMFVIVWFILGSFS